jgi:hypothetical protein
MPKKGTLPDDDALKLEARATLIDVMRNATKLSPYTEVVCKDCGKRQRVQVEIKDFANAVKAAGEIIDRIEGKAATKREVPKTQTTGRVLEELTDEELEALLTQEDENGKTDGETA